MFNTKTIINSLIVTASTLAVFQAEAGALAESTAYGLHGGGNPPTVEGFVTLGLGVAVCLIIRAVDNRSEAYRKKVELAYRIEREAKYPNRAHSPSIRDLNDKEYKVATKKYKKHLVSYWKDRL